MGKDDTAIASANPFGLLASKKLKGDPNKLKGTSTSAAATQPKAEEKKIVDTGPAKQSRVISITATPVSEAAPKEQTKAERELKDRHVDRSTKRDHTRKDGRGKGGWEEGKAQPEEGQDAERAAATAEGAEGEEGAAAAPAEPVEEEKPTLTLSQYQELQAKKKAQAGEFKVRQVDSSAFKNMTQFKAAAEEDSFLKISKKVEEVKKPVETKKPEPKGKAGKKGAVEKVVEAPKKVDNHVKARKENKDAAKELELGFRLESRFGSGGRGEGRGRGRGRGRGFGRGRGGEGAEGAPEAIEGQTPAAETAEGTPADGAVTEPAAEGASEATPAASEEQPAAPASPQGGRGEGRGYRGRGEGRGEGRGYRGRGEGRGEGRGFRGGDREGFRGDREGGRGFGGRGGRGRGRDQAPQQPNLNDDKQFPALGAK